MPEPVLTPPNFDGPRLPTVDEIDEASDAETTLDRGPGEPLNRALVIDYEDADGFESRRRVRLIEVFSSAAGQVYLKCYCLERRAPRNFRLDRVLEAYCGVTGEALALSDPVFRPTRTKPSQARKVGGKSHTGSAPPAGPPEDPAMLAVRAGLRVLMTIARADGKVHPNEEQEIRYFISGCLGYGVADEEGLVMEAYYMAPSFENFLDDCDTVFSLSPDVGLRVLETAAPVANADGVVHESEVQVIEDLAFIARAHGIEVRIEV